MVVGRRSQYYYWDLKDSAESPGGSIVCPVGRFITRGLGQ